MSITCNNNNSLLHIHVTTNKNDFCSIFEMELNGIKKSATVVVGGFIVKHD